MGKNHDRSCGLQDYLHHLLTFEIEEKDKCTLESRIRNACFPYKQYLEDIEMDCLPKDMQKKAT